MSKHNISTYTVQKMILCHGVEEGCFWVLRISESWEVWWAKKKKKEGTKCAGVLTGNVDPWFRGNCEVLICFHYLIESLEFCSDAIPIAEIDAAAQDTLIGMISGTKKSG